MQRFAWTSIVLISSLASADVTDEVRCREIGFSKSVENRDIEAFKSFVDADARFISNRPRRGVDEIAEGWSTFMVEDGPRIRWRPQYVEVLEDGKLAPGEAWRQQSITGSVFESHARIEGQKVLPVITGSAYITGESTLLIDPDDPFRHGLTRPADS